MDREKLPTIFSLAASDPQSQLIQRGDLQEQDLAQIDAIMAQMGRLRAVERKISRASQQYMKLNETDMRAIRMLIAARHREEVVTPGQLAKHLASAPPRSPRCWTAWRPEAHYPPGPSHRPPLPGRGGHPGNPCGRPRAGGPPPRRPF